jgi:hypothetical protein
MIRSVLGIRTVVEQALHVDAPGVWVGPLLDGRAEEGDVALQPSIFVSQGSLNRPETVADGSRTAVGVFGEPSLAVLVEVAALEDLKDCGQSIRLDRLQAMNQGYCADGDLLGVLVWLRVISGQEFTGRPGCAKTAVVGEEDAGLQGEEVSLPVGEELASGELEVGGGWDQEDEGVLMTNAQFVDGSPEVAWFGLDGQEDGHGAVRPGADLQGVEEGEFVLQRHKAEGVAEAAAELGPMKFPDLDLGRREQDVRTARAVAAAHCDDTLGSG